MFPTSQQPHAGVLEGISDGIFVLDPDWRFVFINSGGARLVERSAESLVGRVIWEEFPEAIGTTFDEEYRRAMQRQVPSEFDVYFPPLERWFQVRTMPSPDALTVIYQDVTQRRAADDAIGSLLEQLQRQRRLATVLAETNEVVFRAQSIDELFNAAVSIAVEHGGFVGSWIGIVDSDTGLLTDVAHAGEGMGAYLRTSLPTARHEPRGLGIGGRALRTAQDTFSNDILSDARMSPWRDAATRVGYRSSGALPLSVNGEVRGLLSVYAREPSYFNDDERNLVHRLAANVAYGWDVLQREEALRESDVARRTAQRFRAVLSSAPDAILGLHRGGRIDMANDRVQTLFDWSVDEVLGQSIDALIHYRSPESTFAEWFDLLRDVGPTIATDGFTAVRRDGTRFPAEVALSSVTDDHGDRTIIVSVHDLTERLELEAQRRHLALEEQREQQDLLDSLGRLAGGMAHDFNNLLGAILNFTTLMERQDLASQTRDDLAQVRAAAERGAALTRQLLTFARREPARTEMTDVAASLRNIAKLVDATLGPLISLDLELSPDPLVVQINPQQLDQVIVNLTINARDAMPDGGRLAITASSSRDPEASVTLRVSDTGVGMSREVASRAFEPFFTTKPRGQGTGLGLATVYGVVSRAGGTITMHSRPGEGTTFEIHLPATDGDGVEPESRDEAPSTSPSRGERILLVEDDPQLREATLRILLDAGYVVRVANDGQEARDLLDDLPITVDAVVSDIVMPGLSGIELANYLDQKAPPLPIVLMTGYDSGPAPLERPVLLKPVDSQTLLRALEEVLRDR